MFWKKKKRKRRGGNDGTRLRGAHRQIEPRTRLCCDLWNIFDCYFCHAGCSLRMFSLFFFSFKTNKNPAAKKKKKKKKNWSDTINKKRKGISRRKECVVVKLAACEREINKLLLVILLDVLDTTAGRGLELFSGLNDTSSESCGSVCFRPMSQFGITHTRRKRAEKKKTRMSNCVCFWKMRQTRRRRRRKKKRGGGGCL